MPDDDRYRRVFGLSPARQRNLSAGIFAVTASLSGLGLLGKLPLIERLIRLPHPLLFCAVLLSLALPFLWPAALRYKKIAGICFVLLIAVASFVIYPRTARMHSIGRGSDQPDCVIIAANRMAALQWPYDKSAMWSHNPMSCGPGWVAAQVPAIRAAGYPADLFLIWAVSLASVAWAAGFELAVALAALLAISPGVWMCASNGADFLPFGIALTALLAVAERLRKPRLALLLVSCLVAQFRIPTLVLPGFLAGYIGIGGAIFAGVLALATQVCFLLFQPARFVAEGPLHVWAKLMGVAASPLHTALVVAVLFGGGSLALLTACWAGKRWRPEAATLFFLFVVLGGPAVLNLVAKFRTYGVTLDALGFWEGGIWLSACVPLAAYILLRNMKTAKAVDVSPPLSSTLAISS